MQRPFERTPSAEPAPPSAREGFASGPAGASDTKPTVSVVIATRNRPAMLTEAMASVRRQQVEGGIEMLVVDDASDPESAAENQRLVESDTAARYLRNDRCLGPGASRNRAIEAARGRYVAILDDDDLALPDRFRAQIAMLDSSPEVGVVCGLAEWIDQTGEVFATWPGVMRDDGWPTAPDRVFRLLLLQSNKIPHSSVMIRSDILKQNPYSSDLRIGEDWLLWLQLSSSGIGISATSVSRVRMRRGREHMSLMREELGSAHQCQRQVLARALFWAEQRGTDVARADRRAAWSNQFAREAAQLGGGAAPCDVALGPSRLRRTTQRGGDLCDVQSPGPCVEWPAELNPASGFRPGNSTKQRFAADRRAQGAQLKRGREHVVQFTSG